jgi:hypothetical protein
MDIISTALEIAEEYPVFPCDVKKRPVCQGGFKAATQDPDEIERLFSTQGAALIGVPTGAISGLSVIDIDVRDGKQGEKWVKDNAELLGQTRVAETQSGGWHYYYRHSGDIRNRAGIDGCVDVRGDGGYVIFPCSIGYKWLNDNEFAPFPKKVAAQASGVAGNSLSAPMGASDTDAWGNITDGREKYMARIVLASVADYYRENGVFPSMDWMVENVYPQYEARVKSRTGDLNAEGRGIDEFRKKVNSTIARGLQGKLTDLHIAPVKADATVGLPESLGSVSGRAFERQIKLRTLGELSNTPPPTFMIADYLIEKSFAVMYGAPSSYKSFLAIDWALSIAHGADWNGRPTQQGIVVYLAMEGQSGITNRAEAWHRDRKLSNEGVPFYAVTNPISMADAEATDVALLSQAVKDLLGDVNPSLFVVDTLARSFGGADENSATDMGIFVRNCDILREQFDCSVLAVHHSGKDVEKGLRGSSALLGAVDTSIALGRKAETQQVCVKNPKQKDVEEAAPLWLEAREVSFVREAFGQEQTSLVLDVLEDAPQNDKKAPTSKHRDFAVGVLRDMLDDGFLVTDGEFSGVRLGDFKDELNRRSITTHGKPYHTENHKRITTSWACDNGSFVIHNNELINERW